MDVWLFIDDYDIVISYWNNVLPSFYLCLQRTMTKFAFIQKTYRVSQKRGTKR